MGGIFFWGIFMESFLLDLLGNLLKESWIIENYRGHGEMGLPFLGGSNSIDPRKSMGAFFWRDFSYDIII